MVIGNEEKLEIMNQRKEEGKEGGGSTRLPAHNCLAVAGGPTTRNVAGLRERIGVIFDRTQPVYRKFGVHIPSSDNLQANEHLRAQHCSQPDVSKKSSPKELEGAACAP